MEHNHANGCACGHCDGHGHSSENINKGDFLFKVIGGAVLLILGYVIGEFTKLPDFASLLCFGISYILVGFSVIKEAVEGIIKGNIFNECFLMAIASIGAFAIKEYTEGCAVVLLYTVGEYMQSAALAKSRHSIYSVLEEKGISSDCDEKNSKTEKFISRFAKIYTPAVCLIAVLIIVIPPVFFGGEWNEWLYRGLSALVTACPCAIVISVPLGFYGGISACLKRGIFVRDSNQLEGLAKGSAGTAFSDTASEQEISSAGVIIIGSDKSKITSAEKISKKTMLIVRENIVFSIGIKLIIIIGSAVGIFDENAMWLAVFGDVGVCLLAILNSLRVMIYGRKVK